MGKFITEVKKYKLKEFELDVDTEVLKKFTEQLSISQIIIIGEAHELYETPNILYTILKKFNITKLGLEITPEIGALIEDKEIDKIEEMTHPNCSSGVLTAGHIPLISSLNTTPIYFDFTNSKSFEKDQSSRTLRMIERFTKFYLVNENTKILVSCGDAHAMMDEISAGDQSWRPFALRLQDLGYKVLSIKMRYTNGEIGTWTNWGKWDEEIPKTVYNNQVQKLKMIYDGENFILQINNLHKGLVPNENIKFDI